MLDISRPPVQRELDRPDLFLQFGDYVIRPLATFQGKARVLGAESYHLGRESELSPVDLALGWGPMAKDEVLATIDIRQSGRFYFWRAEQLVIPRRNIETSSANMHMIPGNSEVEKQLRRVREGDVIKFRGYLVRVEASDGWNWTSSLTRDDTGAGACELILLESLV